MGQVVRPHPDGRTPTNSPSVRREQALPRLFVPGTSRELKDMEKLFKQYAFLAQVVAFVAAAITGVVSGGIHGVVEYAIVATALMNALNVYVTPNLSEGVGRFAKGISAVVLAVAGALTPALVANGLDTHTVWMLIEVGVGAVLGFAPNGGYRFAVKRGLVREPAA